MQDLLDDFLQEQPQPKEDASLLLIGLTILLALLGAFWYLPSAVAQLLGGGYSIIGGLSVATVIVGVAVIAQTVFAVQTTLRPYVGLFVVVSSYEVYQEVAQDGLRYDHEFNGFLCIFMLVLLMVEYHRRRVGSAVVWTSLSYLCHAYAGLVFMTGLLAPLGANAVHQIWMLGIGGLLITLLYTTFTGASMLKKQPFPLKIATYAILWGIGGAWMANAGQHLVHQYWVSTLQSNVQTFGLTNEWRAKPPLYNTLHLLWLVSWSTYVGGALLHVFLFSKTKKQP